MTVNPSDICMNSLVNKRIHIIDRPDLKSEQTLRGTPSRWHSAGAVCVSRWQTTQPSRRWKSKNLHRWPQPGQAGDRNNQLVKSEFGNRKRKHHRIKCEKNVQGISVTAWFSHWVLWILDDFGSSLWECQRGQMLHGGLAASRLSILRALSILSGQLITAANDYLESSS